MGVCKGCNGHLYGCQYEDNDISFCDDKEMTNMMTNEAYKDGYDAGYNQCDLDWQTTNAKEERYRWHDLRKNPNDYPKVGEQEYLIAWKRAEYTDIYYEIGSWEYAEGHGFGFHHPQSKYIIAWREIEPFEEE